MKKLYLLGLCIMSFALLQAQSPSDGWMMGKATGCTVLGYEYNTWTKYWEGTYLRNNQNIGRLNSHKVTLGHVQGITDRLNIMAFLPFVSNSTKVNIMHSQSNLQDISLFIKGTPFRKIWPTNEIHIIGVAGFSTPVGNYYPDYLPISIGMGSTNGIFRAIAHYHQTSKHIFATAEAAYTIRSNVRLARDFYYTDGGYYTNIMDLADVASWSVTAGYYKPTIKAQLSYNVMNVVDGPDIRVYDMPYLNDRFISTQVGAELKFRPKFAKGFGLFLGGNYTLTGRNVGKSWGAYGILLYEFQAWGKKDKTKTTN